MRDHNIISKGRVVIALLVLVPIASLVYTSQVGALAGGGMLFQLASVTSTSEATTKADTPVPNFADPQGTAGPNVLIAPPYQEIRAIGDAGGAQWWDLYPRLKGMQVKDWSGWVIAPLGWSRTLDGLTSVWVDMDDPSTPEGKLGIPEVTLVFKSPIDLTQLYDHRKIRFSGTIDNPPDATYIPMKAPQIWLLP